MEPEVTQKGQRRKLKRVVQKKKKINLNNSASVMYYKKVKAALNGSSESTPGCAVNASRVSQTLKANNKALAQSLQHVKQELRYALNENGRLKVENQELTMKLLRLETYVGTAPEQAGYEERLHGLKTVLNKVSEHLLELGNCVGYGMDLCLVSPRTSQTSSSRPRSMEEFKDLQMEEMEGSTAQPSPVSDLNQLTAECEVDHQWQGEIYGDGVGQNSLGKMTPDMSIIMEQSILDLGEGQVSQHSCMTAVPEFPLESSKSRSDCKKVSALNKLPQRVLNGGSAKNSKYQQYTGSPVSRSKVQTPKSRPLSAQNENKKGVDHRDGTVPEKASATGSPPCPCRETYVVSRNVEKIVDNAAETSSTGSVEDISNIPMPDLVSASPMKDDHEGEVFDPDTAEHPKQNMAQDTQPDCSLEKSQAEETSSQNTPAVDKRESGSKATGKEKRKSAGKKIEPDSAKHTKASTVKTNRVAPPSKKDAEFFISNPCALNLVHKRVTGSSEGCLDPAQQSQEQSQPASTVDQFMAHIKESNRNSTKLASFFGVDNHNATQQSCKSTDNHTEIKKSRRSSGAGFQPESEDQTMYFNSDMEFTAVLPLSQNMVQDQVRKATSNAQKEEVKTPVKGKKKEESRKKESHRMARSKSGRKNASEKELATEKNEEEVDTDKLMAGPDKKLAVALRVNKPGQMVFAASRKEEDGSRKAIPAKLQSRSRSKSKKQVEEMAKNLPQKEPECIFDFHDQTPRPSAAEGKADQGKGSVFDLSLNDTVPGVTASLASHREMLKVSNNEREKPARATGEDGSTGKGEKVPSVLLGDAPVYSVPLKDDLGMLEPKPRSRGRSSSRSKATDRQSSSRSKSQKEGKEQDNEPLGDDCNESEPRPRSRSRSSSRSRNSGRQTRSRSKSRTEEEEQFGKVFSPGSQSQASRSRSRTRTKTEMADDDANKEDEDENTKSNDGNRIKSESRPSVADNDNAAEKPRRSARSRSRTHKTYTEDNPLDDSICSSVSSPTEKKAVQGRSRSRVKKCDDEDEDYVPSVRSQPRGRSRRRQAGEQHLASGAEQENPVQLRGRSRSRKRKESFQANDTENESSTGVTSVNRDVQESQQDSTSVQQSQSSHNVVDVDEDLQGKKTDKMANGEKTGSVESEILGREPLRLITDRRQRSKSSLKKLYSEADLADDPFGFSASVDKTHPDSHPATGLEKQVRHRSRSRGTRLLGREDTDRKSLKDSSDNQHQKDHLSETSSTKHQEGVADKRKITSEHSESERDVSPNKKLCREESLSDTEKVAEGLVEATVHDKSDNVTAKQTEHSKDSISAAVNSPLLKKRKSGLPVPVSQTEEVDKVSPAVSKTKSKSVSKLPEPKSSGKLEKTKYQLELEDLRRKLKEMDYAQSAEHSDLSSLPVKKSRPLVLPMPSSTEAPGRKKPPARSLSATDTEQANSKAATRSKKGRSQPGSPKTKKGSKCAPDSPVPRTSASTLSSAVSSPRLVENRSSLGHPEPTDESSQADGRRGRRAAASVCYKEPSLNVKLRRGDPHTTFLHKEQMTHIYKSPKTQRKHGKSDVMDRSALHDLTNTSIKEVDKE